jgi:murein DD-endopeptidase MepM/ murein hydrolase activator NlpD
VAETRAETAREAAAAQLADTQQKLGDAAAAESSYSTALSEQQAAQLAATQALDDDQARYEELLAEQRAVNERIAAEARRAAEQRSNSNSYSSGDGGGNSGGGSSGLIYPVNGYITSSYGMRVHPVTGIYKLHDGTDFGAACGTPIKAAASGRITQAYYNGGYGNRLFIDHGSVNGRYMVTAYNHISTYRLSVGDWVNQGDVVAYVGSTGYSTGCHLHLMLWVGGSMVNPAGYL